MRRKLKLKNWSFNSKQNFFWKQFRSGGKTFEIKENFPGKIFILLKIISLTSPKKDLKGEKKVHLRQFAFSFFSAICRPWNSKDFRGHPDVLHRHKLIHRLEYWKEVFVFVAVSGWMKAVNSVDMLWTKSGWLLKSLKVKGFSFHRTKRRFKRSFWMEAVVWVFPFFTWGFSRLKGSLYPQVIHGCE